MGFFVRIYMRVFKKIVIYLRIKRKYTWQKNARISCSRNDCKYTWEKTARISCHNFETNGRLYSLTWRGSNPRKYRGHSSFQVIFASYCFYYITHSKMKRAYTFVCWVTLKSFPSSLLYRVELFLLHLKVIDGKFKEGRFRPIRISVTFLWTSTNTTVCWHFCL